MNFDSVLIYLPERLSKALINLKCKHITEIRMRTGGPVSVTCEKGNITFDEKGRETTVEKGMITTSAEMDLCVSALCNYSRYSFEETIKNGFFPLAGGGRAGVCGRAFMLEGRIISALEITSINIRLNTFIPFLAKEAALLMKERPCGILVISPPGEGKTTYLKSLIHLISTGEFTPAYRVGVVDERFELSEGIARKGFCDFLCGINKKRAIELLTRTMSPEIIVCDEISEDDVSAILGGCNTGVSFVCSVHGKNEEDVKKREFVKKLFEAKLFSYTVGIEKKGEEYLYKITKIEER